MPQDLKEVSALSKLRVTFEKGEAIRYIGHLDILRSFVRAMRRADIPLKYSEGFNPHAVMTFILPMGVGVTSTCEIVDISLREDIPVKDFISSFNSVTQNGGIKIISAEYTDEKMPVIEKAEYVIEIISETEIKRQELENAFKMKEIPIEKKSKKTVSMINMAEHMFEKEIISCDKNNAVIRLVISAGNTFNIKPSVAVNAIASVCESLNPLAIKPKRTKFIFEE